MNKYAVVFPGQGSQYVGMAKDLYSKNELVRDIFSEASEVLGYDIAEKCFDISAQELMKTEITQPAILTVSVATYQMFIREYNIKPSYFAGHSLGEITALVCSGAIEFKDAVKIVQQRGKLMQNAVPEDVGGMMAISGVKRNIIRNICDSISNDNHFVSISGLNTFDQTVVSGHWNALNELEQEISSFGARVSRLKVSAPFHCKLMNSAAEGLQKELLNYRYSTLNIPVIANVNGLPYVGVHKILENLTEQMVKPIQWNSTMQFLKAQGVNNVIEVGPKNVLKNMAKAILADAKCYAYDLEEDQKKLKEQLDSTEVDKWRFMTRCLAIAVATKNTNWNQDEYKLGVIEPYNRIKDIIEDLELKGEEPSENQMKEAFEMLKSVLNTKGIPQEEKLERYTQLFNETNSHFLFGHLVTH